MTRNRAILLLVIMTIIWGLSFPLTQIAIKYGTSPNFIVFIKGIQFFLLSLIFFRKIIFKITKKDFIAAIGISLTSLIANVFQVMGLKYTSVSNNAFITVSYVVLVPIVVLILYKIKPVKRIFFCIPLCILGMGILTGFFTNAQSFNIGDFYTIIAAVAAAFMLVLIAHSNLHHHIIAFVMSMFQVIGGFFIMLFTKDFSFGTSHFEIIIPILLFLGIIGSFAVGAFQFSAQKSVSATTAALIMTLESVFASFFAIAFGMESITATLCVGGILIIVSVVVMEIDFKKTKLQSQ